MKNIEKMYKTTKAKTKAMSLDELVDKLKSQTAVDALLVMGSAATGRKFTPYSDYDIVIVLNACCKPKLESSFTYINHRVSDVYFFYTDKLDKLMVRSKAIDSNSLEGILLSWIKTGKIVFDKSQRLSKLSRNKKLQALVRIPDSRKYALWFIANRDYAHNLRMFNSKNPLYLKTLEMRLLGCISGFWYLYLELRDITGKAEKEAVKYLEKEAPEYLAKYLQCIRTVNLEEKFKLYTSLVETALLPAGGIWDEESTAIFLGEEFKPELVQQGLDFWNKLLE